MLDVGAHHGQSLRWFAHAGWTVHAFEPDPCNWRVLAENCACLENVKLVERAVAETDDLELDLYSSELSSGISSLHEFHSSHRAMAKVRTVRIDTYLRQTNCGAVDFIKVDAEGHDLPILRTVPWADVTPLAVIAEFEDRKTVAVGYRFEDLANFLAARGYAVLVSEWFPVEEYGSHHRWRRLFRYPDAIPDVSAWGNVIALQPRLVRPARRAFRRAQLRRRVTSVLVSARRRIIG
jgi:FkbM family methyltransferase